MKQKHNTQLANFDVTSSDFTAAATTQKPEIASHSRPRYAAEILCLQKEKDLTRARMQLAACFFLDRCKTMSFQKNVDEKIKEAIARGEFDNLPGKGKPLDLDAYFATP